MPSSVFCPGCSFIVILNDHFQQRCSSARSPKHPFHQSPYSLSLVSPSLLQRAAVRLSAAYVSVHPPLLLIYTAGWVSSNDSGASEAGSCFSKGCERWFGTEPSSRAEAPQSSMINVVISEDQTGTSGQAP